MSKAESILCDGSNLYSQHVRELETSDAATIKLTSRTSSILDSHIVFIRSSDVRDRTAKTSDTILLRMLESPRRWSMGRMMISQHDVHPVSPFQVPRLRDHDELRELNVLKESDHARHAPKGSTFFFVCANYTRRPPWWCRSIQ